MTIAPVKKVDQIIKDFMKLHPIEGEEVLFSTEAKFNCENLWGEDEITGLCFATNYRFGLVGQHQQLLYSVIPYYFIRDIFTDGEETLYYRSCGDDWQDKSQDSIYIITFNDDELLDQAIEHIIHFRYSLSPEAMENKLPEIYRLMHRSEYQTALEQLQKLKEMDSLSGIIDLWIAKVLHVTGKVTEAASHIAKDAWKPLLFHPAVFLSDYLWYPWHNGTLRLLPKLSDLNEDRWEVQRFMLHAIHAKVQGNNEQFIKNSCLAFKCYVRNYDGFDPQWFSFIIKCYMYLNDSTKPYIFEAISLFRSSYENLIKDGEENTLDKIVAVFIEFFNDSYDYITCLKAMQNFDNSTEIQYTLMLAQEQFSELINCKSKKPDLEIPETWDINEFMGYSGFNNDYDTHLLHVRDVAYKTIGAARTYGITSNNAKQGIYQLNQFDFTEKLERLDEYSLIFIIILLKVEEHLANGRKEQALFTLQQWKRKNRHLCGLHTDPYLLHAALILQAYEAWALGDARQLNDTMDKLPRKHPFIWMHGLLRKQLKELEATASGYDNDADILVKMMQASKLTDQFLNSSWLDLAMKNRVKEFSRLLHEQLQEADSIQNRNGEVAVGLENGVTQQRRASWLDKTKSWFAERKAVRKQTTVADATVNKPLKQIKIAIAGESSAGKTTLLNAIFRTNLFFVTQEEATGVPTEIRYGERMRMEVWDKGGQVRNSMETEHSWFQEDGTTLLETHLNTIRVFLMQHTRVGSPALEWVERVVVYAPLDKLPPHVVLVDTPGFNSDQRRTEITVSEMKLCHMCLYIMDARNALKGNEMSTLEFIREEAGKTFILLNKMDLVLGDDELDCDGGDAADETVARVRRDLAAYFQLPDVVIYPISSMPKEHLTNEAYRYADHLYEVIDAIFLEAEHQQLDLIIDASAKNALEVHQDFNRTFVQSVEKYEQEILRMERAVPQDFTIYEDQVQTLIRNSIAKHRSEFIDVMRRELDDAFNSAADSMATWLQGVTSAGRLKNEVQGQATAFLQNALTRIDGTRQRELERMGKRVTEEAAAFLQELYSNLPFSTSFDSKSFLRSFSTENLTSSAGLQTELSNINYGNGLNGGSVAGAIVGTFLLGPIGTVIGGFIGQLLGGKSLGDVKSEVYNTYINTINTSWEQVANICDQDLSEDRTASFLNRLNAAVQRELVDCKNVVRSEIESKKSVLNDQVSELIRMQLATHELNRIMNRLRQWRIVRRARLG